MNPTIKQIIKSGQLSGTNIINLSNALDLNVKVFTIDSIPSHLSEGNYIILLSHTNTGHWTAIRVNKYTAAYYDSFGVPPPSQVIKAIGHRILFFSDDEDQRLNMNYCGQLCMLFLLKIRGQSPLITKSC